MAFENFDLESIIDEIKGVPIHLNSKSFDDVLLALFTDTITKKKRISRAYAPITRFLYKDRDSKTKFRISGFCDSFEGIIFAYPGKYVVKLIHGPHTSIFEVDGKEFMPNRFIDFNILNILSSFDLEISGLNSYEGVNVLIGILSGDIKSKIHNHRDIFKMVFNHSGNSYTMTYMGDWYGSTKIEDNKL